MMPNSPFYPRRHERLLAAHTSVELLATRREVDDVIAQLATSQHDQLRASNTVSLVIAERINDLTAQIMQLRMARLAQVIQQITYEELNDI